MIYTVSYELDAVPSAVTIELICKNQEDAQAVYEDRKTIGTCKKCKSNEYNEPYPKIFTFTQ